MSDSSEQENQASVGTAIRELSQELAHVAKDLKKWVSLQNGFSAREMVAVVSILIGLLGMWMNWREQIKLSQVSQIQAYIDKVELRQQNLIRAMSRASTLVINQINSCPVKDSKTLKKMRAARLNSLIDVRAYASGMTIEVDRNIFARLKKFIKHIYFIPENKICTLNSTEYDIESSHHYNETDTIFRRFIKARYQKIKDIQKNKFW